MYSDSDLEAAVAAGALSPDAAAGLRTYVSDRRASPAVDEEHFRLLTGFNDIFVAIAAVILLVAVAWIGNAIPPRMDGDGPSIWAGFAVAATAWGLAEFFTRKRRMALPSIILLLAFVGGVFTTAAVALGLMVPEHVIENNNLLAGTLISLCAALAAGGAYVHWRRFKVPITVAAGAAAVAGIVIGFVVAAVHDLPEQENVLLGTVLALGIAVFLFAMRWDSSDPTRQTRRSDVAFWLHLLAAPMIVHPVFALLGLTDGNASVIEAAIVVLVYILLGLTALAIDRRALLVSALAYVLWALSDLFERFGAIELNFALTAFVIGSALLLLSAFWHSVRAMIVRPLPAGLQAKLPGVDRVAVPA